MLVNPDRLREFSKKIENEKSTANQAISNSAGSVSGAMSLINASGARLTDYSFLDTYQYAKTQVNQVISSLSHLQEELEDEARDVENADKYAFTIDYKDLFMNLGIASAAHYSKLLQITTSKKGNHYIFKYNRKVSQFLKGKIGPGWLRERIQKFNRTMKAQRLNAKTLTVKGGFPNKIKAKVIKSQARSLPELLKKKTFKSTGADMVIKKGAFFSKFAKGNAVVTLVGTTMSEISSTKAAFAENEKKYSGEKLHVENARTVGEATNRVAMRTGGALAGAYIGAAAGSLLGPIGTVAGGFIGAAVGDAVGGWAAKYTSDFAGKVAVKTRETFNNIKDGIKDKVFGWL